MLRVGGEPKYSRERKLFSEFQTGIKTVAGGSRFIITWLLYQIFILLYKVVSVFCLSRKISLTAEPILFSFTV